MTNNISNTNLVRTINGSKRTILYYDPDIFDEKIILSVSLIIDNDTDNINNDLEYDIPYQTHWNSIFDEDTGTNGTAWQELEDIAIAIYPVPKRTNILGKKSVKPYTTSIYNLSPDYDQNNEFVYEWSLIGPAEFVSNGTNFVIDDKQAEINFLDRGTVTIKIKVTNSSGCFRYLIRNIFVGEVTRKMLVVRYPYY